MYDVESKPPTGERSTRTILLVEDEARDAELISELIIESGRHGDRVLHVTSLQAALQTMAAEPVDLILLDLRLPDGVGLDCLQTVRQESVEIPVVVLTGVEDEHLALSCISGGAQDYLTKNELEGRTLNRAIAYALTRSRELSERRRANDLQRRLASIVEASQDAIVSISPDGLLMSWNPGAERTFGLGEVEALGRPFADFVRPLGADGETTDLSLDRLLAADQGMPIEMMSRRADGQRITLSVATCHLRDDDDRLIGLVSRSDALGWRQGTGGLAATLDETLSDSQQPTAYPETPCARVAELMVRSGIGRIPVVSATDGKVVGIITRHDLLRARTKQLHEETVRTAPRLWAQSRATTETQD